MTDGAASNPDDLEQPARSEEQTASAQTVTCPACNTALEVILEPTARLINCPECGAEFVIPAIDGSTEITDPDEAAHREYRAAREQELDGQRMRQIVATKRSAIRTRTYCIVGACVGVIGAAKLVELTVRYVLKLGWEAQPVGYLLFAAALLVGSLWCLRRAAYWNAESRLNPFAGKCAKCGYDLRASPEKCPECGEPVGADLTNPDFTALSDGSHFARDLEDVK